MEEIMPRPRVERGDPSLQTAITYITTETVDARHVHASLPLLSAEMSGCESPSAKQYHTIPTHVFLSG